MLIISSADLCHVLTFAVKYLPGGLVVLGLTLFSFYIRVKEEAGGEGGALDRPDLTRHAPPLPASE